MTNRTVTALANRLDRPGLFPLPGEPRVRGRRLRRAVVRFLDRLAER